MKINKTLVRGSFSLLIAFGLFNFLQFIFQFSMARMLSISDYGILATLSSIIYILLIFTESIQTIITKYSSIENDNGKLKNLLIKSLKKTSNISLIMFVCYLGISLLLSPILKISYLLLSFSGLIIFLIFFKPVTLGILQGKEKFKALGTNMVLEAFGKLILSIFFVYLGWKVYGAMMGVILGGLFSFSFSFFQLKDILRAKERKIKIEGIYDYAKPTFLIMGILIIFYSLDVIIAKIVFSPEIAGTYAIASVLGKIVFWGTLPISKAMLPLTSSNYKSKRKSKNLFMNALGILLIGIVLLLTLFYIFPEILVKLFSGKMLPGAITILFYEGLAFGFISLANLILIYKLSIGKLRGYQFLIIFVLIEISLLSYFSDNLIEFSIAFITSSVAFLWGTIYLLRE
tara:strand:- start:3387 stop:4592 length:1206 start_codon:yes stop_codon:yes gene_type:complete